MWYLSQIALHRSLRSHRKSLLRLHPSRHLALPRHRNKTLLLLNRSLKLAIMSRILVIKSSLHLTSSRWTMSLHFFKLRAPRRISTYSVMCSQVYKSGTFRLNKLVEISVQCLWMSMRPAVPTDKNCNYSKKSLYKRYARWLTKWRASIDSAKAALCKLWKKTANGKRSLIRCSMRKKRPQLTYKANLRQLNLKRWSSRRTMNPSWTWWANSSSSST